MRFLTEDIKPQESFYVLGRATLSINLDRLWTTKHTRNTNHEETNKELDRRSRYDS
jgi:hypothetical protein